LDSLGYTITDEALSDDAFDKLPTAVRDRINDLCREVQGAPRVARSLRSTALLAITTRWQARTRRRVAASTYCWPCLRNMGSRRDWARRSTNRGFCLR